ncbi:MAG TPA: FxDxF family PEP-CTERM protein [Sphingomicrobium sp.]|jgi:hypothetical protein
MRKVLVTVAGAFALAAASAANAAFIENPVNLAGPPTVSVNGNVINIGFVQDPLASGSVQSPTSFTGGFDINNTAAGNYTFDLTTSSPGITFTGGSITNLATMAVVNFLLGSSVSNPTPNTELGLPSTFFGIGDYRIAWTGQNTDSVGSDAGVVHITSVPAVPEPATWAMMLLGFGGIGFAMRRRRNPVLAQLA